MQLQRSAIISSTILKFSHCPTVFLRRLLQVHKPLSTPTHLQMCIFTTRIRTCSQGGESIVLSREQYLMSLRTWTGRQLLLEIASIQHKERLPYSSHLEHRTFHITPKYTQPTIIFPRATMLCCQGTLSRCSLLLRSLTESDSTETMR